MSTKFGQILLQISENFYHYFYTLSQPNFTNLKLELYHVSTHITEEEFKAKRSRNKNTYCILLRLLAYITV